MNKSPVVFWTSKWESTGETEIRSGKNNEAKKVEKMHLVGILNKNWKGLKNR